MLEYREMKVSMDLDNLPCDAAVALAAWYPHPVTDSRVDEEALQEYIGKIGMDIRAQVLKRVMEQFHPMRYRQSGEGWKLHKKAFDTQGRIVDVHSLIQWYITDYNYLTSVPTSWWAENAEKHGNPGLFANKDLDPVTHLPIPGAVYLPFIEWLPDQLVADLG